MKKKRNKIATFVVLSYFTFLTTMIQADASYIMAGTNQLGMFYTVGFVVVLIIVLLAVILLIYSRMTLSNISKKRKKKDEEDYF